MTCNTCKPKVVIEPNCTPQRPQPQRSGDCGCVSEPVCASYADVRKLVMNWLYDLDTSVGFGKTLENFVKKSVITGMESNDEIMLELKNKIRDAIIKAMKAEIQSFAQTQLDEKFNLISAQLNAHFSNLTTELDTLTKTKKQILENTVEGIVDSVKKELAGALQKAENELSGTMTEIRSTVTNAKTQIDMKVDGALDRVSTKVDLLAQQLDNRASQALQDINSAKTSSLQDLTHLRDDAVNDIELIVSQAKQDLSNLTKSVEAAGKEVLEQIKAERTSLETYKALIDAKLAEIESKLAQIKAHKADVELADGVGDNVFAYAHSETTK